MTRALTVQNKSELFTLAENLIRAGRQTGGQDLILVGNGLLTLLQATENELEFRELGAVLRGFTERQLKRDAGFTETRIALDEALAMTSIN